MSETNCLARKTPESLGIPSRAILDFATALDVSPLEIHSFMVLRHGAVAAEGWWAPYARELKHMLFSLTKSFTSTGIGLAVQEGRLSVDDPVISFFPDDLPAEISSNLAAMKVKHLLSMSAGTADEDTDKVRGSSDPRWARRFLSLPVKYVPGTHFAYNSDASYMLSAIITKVTGQKLSEYLKPRLFEPLGIEDWSWSESPEGVTIGGSGLRLRTEDIAKFGQLYLDKGVWRGRRILSEEWVKDASSKQISWADNSDSDWAQGYGYQFRLCRFGAYRGDGMFGQFCVIMPEQDAVVAITANVQDMAGVLNLVWQHLLPAMGSEVLPEDDATQKTLAQKLSSLAIAPPSTRTDSPFAKQIQGVPIVGTTAHGEERTITLEFGDDKCSIAIQDGKGRYVIDCGLGHWLMSETSLPGRHHYGGDDVNVAAAGGWLDDYTFKADVRPIELPHVRAIVVRLDGSEPRIDICEV